jgi:predicted dehydrogenase
MVNYKCAVIGGGGGRGSGWARDMKLWQNVSGNTIELVAICDIADLALKKRAEQLKVKAYKDYHELLDKEKLDFVISATPHYMHTPIMIAAAEHGVNILTEKPMCINLKQADEMKAAVDKYKIKCAVGFQHRFNPIYKGIKNAIDAGDLGFVFQYNMIFHWYRGEDYYLNSSPVPENEDTDWAGWRGHWKTEGAGALANQIIHFMDQFLWFSQSPVQSVMAASRIARHSIVETDDNTNTIVEFQNGSMGLCQMGVAYKQGKRQDFQIYGTEGALETGKGLKGKLGIPKFYNDMRKASAKVIPMIKRMGVDVKKLDPTKALFTNFIESIAKDDSKIIAVDVTEGRKSIEFMRGILLSIKEDKKITFPYDDTCETPTLQRTFKDDLSTSEKEEKSTGD